MDYRASWEAWAARIYDDPGVASAASAAAISASASGAAQQAAAVAAHRAAIEAGGEYRCRPNQVVKGIVWCVLIFLLLVPATIAGLSVNPAPAGYAFLVVFSAGPILGTAGLLLVARNSCFFVNKATVGRRDFTGRLAGAIPRSDLVRVALQPGTPANFVTVMEGDVDESIVRIMGRRRSLPASVLFWWTDDRIREFAAVATPNDAAVPGTRSNAKPARSSPRRR